MISSIVEAWPTLLEDLRTLNIGSHHGVGFLAFWHVLRTLAYFREPAEWIVGESHSHSCQAEEKEEE